MQTKRHDTRLVRSLVEQGFDRSFAELFRPGATVRCSRCDARTINGTPCHEHGCPNRVATCRECGNLDPERTCCDE